MTTELVARLRAAGSTGLDLSPGDPLCAEAADEIERLQEEDRQWDKHSLVEIVRERNRLRELLWRIQPILNAGSEIAFKVEREIGSVHTNRERPLHPDVPEIEIAVACGIAPEHEPECGCPACDDSNRGNR